MLIWGPGGRAGRAISAVQAQAQAAAAADDDDQHARLTQQQAALERRLRISQAELDAPSAAAPEDGPTCDSTCAGTGLGPPPSSACSDQFQSWVAENALSLTGCQATPFSWSGAVSCCEDHAACYGTCGMTQPYCDRQRQNCVDAKVSMPECQTAIDTTGLLTGQLSCSAFEAAQV